MGGQHQYQNRFDVELLNNGPNEPKVGLLEPQIIYKPSLIAGTLGAYQPENYLKQPTSSSFA